MNMESVTDSNEVIKVVIVNEDGIENEVDSKPLNYIKLEISNSEDDLQEETKEEDYALDDESLLVNNIKVEVIEDPEEFEEFVSDQNLEGYSEAYYDDQTYITEEEKRTDSSILEKKTIHKCSICGYSSHQKSHYRRHVAIHWKGDGLYCSICKKEMSDKSELSEHMDEHRCSYDMDRYQCNLCDYTSTKLTNVSQHTETHYKPEKITLQCTICEFFTTSQTMFKKHMREHLSTRSNKCPVCLTSFKSMAARRKHLQKYKNGPDGKYQCPECSYKTPKFSNFKQHMVIHRSEYEVEMFQCPHCPFKSKRKTDLRQHIIVKHRTDDEVLLFKCDFCSYESRRGNHLTSHMKNRHPVEAVLKKCGLCSYRTVSQVLINKHCKIHTRQAKHFFLCCFCNKGFLNMNLLDVHKELFHPYNGELIEPALSDDDSKKTNIKDQESERFEDDGFSIELLEVAKDRFYSGEKEMQTLYCCQFEQCNFKSVLERDARIHRTICHNKRGDDNRCPECTFHTSSRYLYLDHLKVHKINIEHLKPHLCDICGTRWIRQGDLTRHMSVHWDGPSEKKRKTGVNVEYRESDKKLLKCSLCDYTTRLRLCLYKHLLKHGKEHQDNFNYYVGDDNSDEMYESEEIYEDEVEIYG